MSFKNMILILCCHVTIIDQLHSSEPNSPSWLDKLRNKIVSVFDDSTEHRSTTPHTPGHTEITTLVLQEVFEPRRFTTQRLATSVPDHMQHRYYDDDDDEQKTRSSDSSSSNLLLAKKPTSATRDTTRNNPTRQSFAQQRLVPIHGTDFTMERPPSGDDDDDEKKLISLVTHPERRAQEPNHQHTSPTTDATTPISAQPTALAVATNVAVLPTPKRHQQLPSATEPFADTTSTEQWVLLVNQSQQQNPGGINNDEWVLLVDPSQQSRQP